MLKQFMRSLVWVLVFFILPLLPKAQVFQRWQIWFAIALAFGLTLTQPAIENKGMTEKTNEDKRSLLAIFIMGILGFMVPVLDFTYGRGASLACACGYIGMLGAGISIVGLSFRVWSIRMLGKFFTSRVEIQVDHQVIQHGPYKWIRHPSYLGSWVMFLGISVMLQSHVGFLVSLLGFYFVYQYRIEAEEAALVQSLGQAYEDYRQKTWKLVPYIF